MFYNFDTVVVGFGAECSRSLTLIQLAFGAAIIQQSKIINQHVNNSRKCPIREREGSFVQKSKRLQLKYCC